MLQLSGVETRWQINRYPEMRRLTTELKDLLKETTPYVLVENPCFSS